MSVFSPNLLDNLTGDIASPKATLLAAVHQGGLRALTSSKMAFRKHQPFSRASGAPEERPSAGKELGEMGREPAAPDRTGPCSSWLKGRDKAPGEGGKRALPASGLQEEGKKSTGGREQGSQSRKHQFYPSRWMLGWLSSRCCCCCCWKQPSISMWDSCLSQIQALTFIPCR